MTFDGFREIEIGDRDLFLKVFEEDPPQTSELPFTNLFVWRHKYRPVWRLEGDCLLMILRPVGEAPFGLPPVGRGDKRMALDLLVRHLEPQTPEPRICRVGEELVEKEVDAEKFEILKDRDNADYVYLSRDLVKLSGRKYHRKKNHLNRFVKTYAAEYRPLDAAIVRGFLEMQESWCQMRECVESPDLLSEDYAVREALTHYEVLDFQGGAILIDSKVEAFARNIRKRQSFISRRPIRIFRASIHS